MNVQTKRCFSLPDIVSSADFVPEDTGNLTILKVIDTNLFVACIRDKYYYVCLDNCNMFSVKTTNLTNRNSALFSKLMIEKLFKHADTFTYQITAVIVNNSEITVLLKINLTMLDKNKFKYDINNWLNCNRYSCPSHQDISTFEFSFDYFSVPL